MSHNDKKIKIDDDFKVFFAFFLKDVEAQIKTIKLQQMISLISSR